jgi:hypothetical protein
MDRKSMETVICEILLQDGPDGHPDGFELITDFIVAMTEGRGAEWAQEYAQKLISRSRTPQYLS